jgi:hypothetical protein
MEITKVLDVMGNVSIIIKDGRNIAISHPNTVILSITEKWIS